jgi:Tfp pilus assembly protein PilF
LLQEHAMTPWCLRWIPSLTTLVVLALGSGCATQAPPPLPAALLQDALFGHPARPADADDALVVDEAMRQYLRSRLAGAARDKGRPRALAEALYARGELRLSYDDGHTRTAAQAFAARAGNCLSLVLMTAALAHEIGLDVVYQSARLGASYSRSGTLTLYAGHVNLVLAPRRLNWPGSGLQSAQDTDALQIDFLPPDQVHGLRTVPISEQRVLAMFLNNRAVESLQQGPAALSYAWAREAVRHDPGFWPAFNTLGVVYQRAGHLAPAAAVYRHVLAHDPDSVPAMANLAQVLVAQGRAEEAAVWRARRLALEPHAPFHFLGLGEAALAQGDLAEAERLLDRESAVTGPTHELAFQRARLQAARGDRAGAQQALAEAMDQSGTPQQRQVYAGKLSRLQALVSH